MPADYGTKTGNERDREWTIFVCPVCGASRLGPLPAWGSWCDGACSHPVTEMEPVRVIDEARPLNVRGAEEGAMTVRLRSWLYIWWREACFRGPRHANRRMFGYRFGRPT